jgi:hypothetical protein
VIAPLIIVPTCRKTSVTEGSIALGTAWRCRTSASRSPLALAVSRYGMPASSIIDERMIIWYWAKTTSTSVRQGSMRCRATSRMCGKPPGVPGVDMPPVAPNADPNSTSRMMPSQKSGTDHRVMAEPVEARSSRLPGRQPLRMPSHMPSSTDTIVDEPISSRVGHSRCRISVETGVSNCQE